MKKAEIIGNKILMIRSGEIFVGLKDGNIVECLWEEGSYQINISLYDETFIIMKNEINFDINDKKILLEYINNNK